MPVIDRLRRQWYRKQGRIPPEDVEAILAMRKKYDQREGETEAEWLARLRRQDDECAAEMDRLEAEEERKA